MSQGIWVAFRTAKMIDSRASGRNANLLTHQFYPSETCVKLQNCKIINWYYFKLLNLW